MNRGEPCRAGHGRGSRVSPIYRIRSHIMIPGGSPNLSFLIRRSARSLPWLAALCAVGALALTVGVLLGRRGQRGLPPNRLIVTVVNVGQGEAGWVRTPGGKFVVIGGGPPGRGADVVASLRGAGADRIALLILPYPYAEAIGGVPEVLRAFSVDDAIQPGESKINQWQGQIRTLLDAKRTSLRAVHAGETIFIDGLRIDVLGPPVKPLAAPPVGANNSLVVRMTWRDTRLLWCGGTERRGEVELLSHLPDLAAQWLRVAHFGTREATSPELLRLVLPEFAVLSVGPNRDGYPHVETLNRLQASGAKVYRTDTQPGNLRFVSDGTSIYAP